MVKKLLVLFLFYSSFTYAETIKTDVLIRFRLCLMPGWIIAVKSTTLL
jgi:hypothetical protein